MWQLAHQVPPSQAPRHQGHPYTGVPGHCCPCPVACAEAPPTCSPRTRYMTTLSGAYMATIGASASVDPQASNLSPGAEEPQAPRLGP